MPQGNIIGALFPMILLFAIMYFMIIRPQKKREKLTREMLNGLIVGDKIVTIGGVVGKISSIKDDEIVIETGSPSEKSYVKFQRSAVREVLKPAPADK